MIKDITIIKMFLNDIKRLLNNKPFNIKARLIIAMLHMKKTPFKLTKMERIKIATIGTLNTFPKHSHYYNTLLYEIEMMQFMGELLKLASKKEMFIEKINIPKGFKPIGIINLYDNLK